MFDDLLTTTPSYNEHAIQGDQSTLTNANLDGDQTIFYASNKKRKIPSTSTPEFAFKRLERLLKDMSTNTLSLGGSKDFIATKLRLKLTIEQINLNCQIITKKEIQVLQI